MPLMILCILELGKKKRARHRRPECVEPECVRIPSLQFDSSQFLCLAQLDWAKLKMESSGDHNDATATYLMFRIPICECWLSLSLLLLLFSLLQVVSSICRRERRYHASRQ